MVIGVFLSKVGGIMDLFKGCVLEIKGNNCSVVFDIVGGVDSDEFSSLQGVISDYSSC